jgi:hypothetical protein
MARSVGIMAYGTKNDRLRLEALAVLAEKSSSQWIIEAIRAAYQEIYGETPPSEVVQKNEPDSLS